MSAATCGTMTSNDGAVALAGARAVVAGHGEFAAGMVSAVQQISGQGSLFRVVSNASLDAPGLEAAIRAAVEETGAHVVFTDLPAGSCTMAARRVARDTPSLAVVTGANLAMLLDFALGGGGAGALDRVIARGHASIAGVPPREGANAD
jgi:PTS system N-acetylgalactosamine-specific IIA component